MKENYRLSLMSLSDLFTFYRLKSPPIVLFHRDLNIFFFFFPERFGAGLITARTAASKTSFTPSPVSADVS